MYLVLRVFQSVIVIWSEQKLDDLLYLKCFLYTIYNLYVYMSVALSLKVYKLVHLVMCLLYLASNASLPKM